MGKFGKVILSIFAVVLVGVIIAVWLFARNLNGLVETAIEDQGSRVLGAPVQVAGVNLSIFDGSGEIRGLEVANPQGFATGNALQLDEARVAIVLESLTRPVIVLRDVTVRGARLQIEQMRDGRNNLDALRRHLESQLPRGSEPQDEPTAAARKIAIEQFNFLDAEVAVRSDMVDDQEVRIPDIRLTDIGDATSGVSIAEAVSRMLQPIIRSSLEEALEEGLRGKVTEQLDKMLDGKGKDQLDKLKGLLQGGKPPGG